MAVKRNVRRSVKRTPVETDFNKSEASSMSETSVGGTKKSVMEKMAPVLVVVLIAMGFVLGAMWSKIKYLETGGGGVAGKYKNLDAALTAYAKELKLDHKKLMSCVTKGDKKDAVDAEAKEGAALGVQGTPGFFINGRFLPGAFPFESFKEVIDKELAGTGSNELANYSEMLQQSGFVATPASVIVGNSAAKGADNAAITLVEYSDFQCPFCQRAKPTVDQILSAYPNQVKFVYKHLPLDQLHPNARRTAEAAECAKDQGKFWEMHDKLFETQTEWQSLPQT